MVRTPLGAEVLCRAVTNILTNLWVHGSIISGSPFLQPFLGSFGRTAADDKIAGERRPDWTKNHIFVAIAIDEGVGRLQALLWQPISWSLSGYRATKWYYDASGRWIEVSSVPVRGQYDPLRPDGPSDSSALGRFQNA
ncbi:MAG: hypothetical protein Q9193_001376 [Seirophora villosa]